MPKIRMIVPPTMDQSALDMAITRQANETPAGAALWVYNSMRDHDGQPPLKRMPKGTVYLPVYLYVVQQYTGTQYGWEDVTQEEDRAEGLQRLREYRENDTLPARMIRRPQ